MISELEFSRVRIDPSPGGHVQFCTIPLDTAKVRLQLQKRVPLGDSAAAPKYRGLLGTVATIAKEEGLLALWKGIIPGLHRQCLYGGLRIGLYEPVCIIIAAFLVLLRTLLKNIIFEANKESLRHGLNR